ncbi:SETX helicase, partial [Crypturellus soui]|nr:SETX helicase [Crypturellus soui]
MSTCRWCTPSGSDTTEFLKNYASKQLSREDLEGSNDDLCYCLECVVEYHRAREKLPGLHEVLWELETSRLMTHIEKSMKEEVGEDDELFIVDENGDVRLSGYVGPDFENNLRVPLLEILKYPYLLLHEKVSELCVEVLCKMEQGQNSFQVFEKYPGIYVFLVHPNEVIRRWAILTARNLGKVDRDDYYDLQEVLTCLFKVIELGLFDSPDIYSSSVIEKGKLILLPSHLYDAANYKNYWLGICMLLTVLEEQAMDSLLLGPDKQNDFMQSILHTMEKIADDDSTDPFWPALHCFMVILDQLGSKVWGQLIDPIQAFQTIINSVSYKNELRNIRDSFKRTKCEPQSDYDDEMVTCSQMVYNYNTEKPQKDTGWKTAICPDYCPNMYEEMQTLANVLQSDIGRDMRVHHSTFLWFIPFVQSLMDLKNLGVEYIVEVIHYLCSEIRDILNEKIQQCDKVSEFFVLILVSIIELHRNKKCLHLLWVSSQEWVEAVVKCAKLPAIAFTRCTEKPSGNYPRGSSSSSSQISNSVQHACVQLIRSLLREGYQIGQNDLCKKYLDNLNRHLRGNTSLGWQLNIQETHELQLYLKKVLKIIKDRAMNTSMPVENNANSTTLPTLCIKQEKRTHDDECKMSVSSRDEFCSGFSFISKGVRDGGCQENLFPRRNDAWEEEGRDASSRYITERDLVDRNIKKEPIEMVAQEYEFPQNSFAGKIYGEGQRSVDGHLVSGNSDKSNWFCSDFKSSRELENKYGIEPIMPKRLDAQISVDSPQRAHSSDEMESNQEKNMNRTFQSTLASIKQESKEILMDCSYSSKNEPALQDSEDDPFLLSGFSNNLRKKGSSEERSSSLLKKNFNVQIADQEQPNLGNFIKDDCEDQRFRTSYVDKTSANGHIPSGFEDRGGVSNIAFQIVPLSMKRESSDESLVSKYFKKENTSPGTSGEDFVRVASGDSSLTDSEVDRDLSKLSLAAYAKSVNFSIDSSQESSVEHNRCDIKRKVKGAVRSSSSVQSSKSPCGVDCVDNQVIIISDSSDGEENVPLDKQTITANEVECPVQEPLTSSCISECEIKKELKTPSSPLLHEECGSQYFEFETEDEVFSVWQDTQLYAMDKTQEYKTDHRVSASVGSSDSDSMLKDYTNEWGYDTDYISDDTIEKEASKVEQQMENLTHWKEATNTEEASSSALQDPISKGNKKDQLENSADKSAAAKDLTPNTELAEPRASTSKLSLASKLAIKKNSVSPRMNLAKSKVLRTTQISPKRTLLKTAKSKKPSQNTSKASQPGRSLPAVVPPRKVRECPAPTSTAEKLGLKKAPRKAFELSQRSLESVAKLRSYGKAAGKVGTAQRQKTKLITPQALSVKNNKKMLACQDLQFLRQTRPKRSGRGKNLAGSSDSRSKKVSKVGAKSVEQKPKSFGLTSVEGGVENRGKKMEQTLGPSTSERKQIGDVSVEKEGIQAAHVSKTPVFSDSNRKVKENNTMISPVSVDLPLYPAAAAEDDKEKPSERGCVVQSSFEKTTSKENWCKSNDNSGDDDDDDLFLTQLDPVDMELCSQEENEGEISIPSKPMEMEIDAAKNLEQNKPLGIVKCKYEDCVEEVERVGEYCSKHSASNSEKDHLFVKPSLPPSKARKPSTTKIFSSVSSSRNAAFTKDLEDVKKPLPPSKSKVNAEKPVVFRPPPAKAVPSGNQVCKTPSFSNIPQPCVSSNVLRPQNIQNASNIPRPPVREEYSSFLGAQQHDRNILVKEILKWTYEMFANFKKYGPPDSLLQSIVVSVPINFQGYNDYFNTFFPLMMLNTFEALVQDWLENQRMKERSYYFNLQNYSAQLNRADFTAPIRESDLARQLHPKEDDLIFLEIQDSKNTFGEESEVVKHLEQPVGLVTRFSRATGSSAGQNEQHPVCHLSVQTRSNLSLFINKKVKCMVAGSLVTTQRMFEGLLLLSRSPLSRTILNPHYNDFYPRGLRLSSESDVSSVCMKDYNKDQRRAIDTAYTLVKEHPTLPKICLIHGPPGTGKSKTIVGFLSRILRENSRSEKSTQKPNCRIKQNRFLVCAPSNAAVDELMKKIILEFKERCQNRQEPLGNCGDIHLVRLGSEKSISSEVRAFSLDKQVEHRMKRKLPNRDQDIQKKKEALDQKLDMLSRQRARHRCEKREVNQMLDDEIGKLSKERQQLASQLKEARGRSQKIQADILLESDIICCTLNTSGGILLKSAFSRRGLDPFSCVIVDEAGQSCEVETLIPLIHRCNKLVLVGDPKQLPPTVKSQKAQEYGYDQSLMARLHSHLERQVQQKICNSLPVVQLTVQYRMHPDICLFPSSYIYGKTLKTDKATEENRCSSEWPFQPYLIFDVGDGQEERDNDSFSNPQEVKLVIELIKAIKEKKKDFGLRQIGIITPYSAQKKKILEELERVFKNSSSGEVDTVDAFQGREKDCIIVTCVRANSNQGSIGFLASLQRLNVTITRARFSLFILGKLRTLMENEDWNKLIQDAKKRGAIIQTLEKSYKKDAAKILKLKPAP